MDISEVIKDLNSRIKAKFPDFRGSYLYGSYAKGTYTKDSDVDIILIFDKVLPYDEEMNVHDIVSDLNCEYDLIIIGIPYTRKQLKKNYVFNSEVTDKGIYYNAA